MNNRFVDRHIAVTNTDQDLMLKNIGFNSIENLIEKTIPNNIRNTTNMQLREALSESDALDYIKNIANKNKVYKTYIGQGYTYSYTPTVILRNILENPAWYTAYTPYQPEISQGRLEALLNFQQMVIDLTKMDVSNASMLDESTAAAEAMTLIKRTSNTNSNIFFIDEFVLPQTIEVIKTRAEPLGIDVIVGKYNQALEHKPFGILLQYPNVIGDVIDYKEYAQQLKQSNIKLIVATDLLSLTILTPPGEWGADVVVGNSQRFGVPVGFGGPHAAFLATKDELKRSMPGRIVGVSIDCHGNKAYRLALQTREQHIRREKATSNICTAQALLAIMASMYACYHGPKGLKNIAKKVMNLTNILRNWCSKNNIEVINASNFDTLTIKVPNAQIIHQTAHLHEVNFRVIDSNHIGISLDETTNTKDLELIISIIAKSLNLNLNVNLNNDNLQLNLPQNSIRNSNFLSHTVFNSYHSEHEMLRYMRSLADKDLALDRTMIPLGSCTMKLNATSEMIPVTWPQFAQIHPFSPSNQTQGYIELINDLEQMLCACTGYAGVSLQPNAGSQGEYAGLLIIKKYHEDNNQGHRDVCLIPSSAHGTNPASAQMAAMQVVVVNCDYNGNIDIIDLTKKSEQHSNNLAAIMITYPSTHGVFEENVKEVAEIVHKHGGQVYIDGANMNALVGTAAPGKFGGDVSHLNLHKTFCIPHGGGGPGIGPVAVAEHLVKYLPNHTSTGYKRNSSGISAISGSAYGSASILPISWMYIAMMGDDGLTAATHTAILSANYIAKLLAPYYPILYTGKNNLVAHECILDIRPIQKDTGITNEDIAKRLIDFGFHAPTMSFPVAGTLMIEPTESESKQELDRFIQAMISIYKEIQNIKTGIWSANDNPLKNAPHTAKYLLQEDWNHQYSRNNAAYPNDNNLRNKYWPPVGRVDNAYGDRNLCTCISISDYT